MVEEELEVVEVEVNDRWSRRWIIEEVEVEKELEVMEVVVEMDGQGGGGAGGK